MPTLRTVPAEDPDEGPGDHIGHLLNRSARGDVDAFERIYDEVSARVLGVAVRVIRNRALAEEVAQEVLVEVWRSSSRYMPERGSALGWIMTIAHRRAVDRVRQVQADADREERVARRDDSPPYDEVADEAQSNFEREQVHRCLGTLTDLQRESVALAYYDGYTYREVAQLLRTPLGTIKTRLRDGLIRLRDCMGLGR